LIAELTSGRLGKRYTELAEYIEGYLEEDATCSEPSFAKRFKDLMAAEVADAMDSSGKILRLACLVNGPSHRGGSYAGIFLCDDNNGEYAFTASHEARNVGDLDKHVLLEVSVSNYHAGRPRLLTRRWVNGLYFFGRQPRIIVVFPWPEALVSCRSS
jgi:hypothetical protein